MLVSVIIPMYNREKTIERAVESILKQTYPNFEIIIVDDCSKDNSVQVVEKIQDERIKLIRSRENGGACVARNIGIQAAEGKVIAFQDSDDYWHEDKLQKSLECLQSKKADFVFSALNRVGERNQRSEGRILPSYNLNCYTDKISRLLCSNCVSTQTIVAKRDVFDKIRFDTSLPRFQDWDLALQVAKEGFYMYYLEEPLVDCFVMENSITLDDKKARVAIEILENKYKDDFEKNPTAYRGFCWRAAYLFETAGQNGSDYFMKAFKAQREIGMLFKYILSKLRLYMPLCSCIDKWRR